MNSKKRVVIGMSGGVDSSVAAAILKEQGYEVIALFMKNWEEDDEFGVCMASKEYEDVIKVSEKLEIPYYSVEFVKEYREQVFSHFLQEYQEGHTPNPDILCNREIKFKVFFEKAMSLGADFLATGHYATNPVVNGVTQLAKGFDPSKDQSYFLYTLKSTILDQVLFPVGDIHKRDVRGIAAKYDLHNKNKKDSTGICFIGERNFKNFLSQFITLKKGNFETLAGVIVGEHDGASYYTIGQRKGLGLGGQGDPWFVVGKDMSRNVVLVERGEDHPALYGKGLYATEITWVDNLGPQDLPFKCQCKIRYRQEDQECTILKIEDDLITVSFDIPQKAITPRQSIVFYKDSICLGGAMIKEKY